MRLDMKREAELAKRKGNTVRTIVSVIWLGTCFVIAYLISHWLFETDVVSISFFYNRLLIPRTVDELYIRIGFVLLIVFIMQFLVLIGYAVASPTGRMRPGNASAYSRDPDLEDSKYEYH